MLNEIIFLLTLQYYRHKDYNHKFRSKPEVQYFLDTGKVIIP